MGTQADLRVVAVAVCCGEVDAARSFGSMPDAYDQAELWAEGFSAGADAFGGDECHVYILPRDEAELDGQAEYVRTEVLRARAEAR